ncbi:MAG: hypothetical protein L6Q71_00485 [Planctomycetes bacterium]|nr:hypothetical protein [Planctomycetota bacterium]NUQ33622.1 hypothetical protein [Planctomycetaceae bacterium]
MSASFRVKLLYLAAGFGIVLLLLLGRLYTMQVVNAASYRNKAEGTTYRHELLFPPRAPIVDLHGRVIASNESVWDCSIDLYEMTRQEALLARARRSPESYPPLEEVLAYYQAAMAIKESQDVSTPRSARRFFARWQLRQHPVAQHDFAQMTAQLAGILGVDETALRAQFALVNDEVDTIAATVGDWRSASRGAIQNAYNEARTALRDPEYWERIRRFPKSIMLEPLLVRRLELSKQRSDIIEALADNIDDHPELALDLLMNASTAFETKYTEAKAKFEQFNESDEGLEAQLLREDETFWSGMCRDAGVWLAMAEKPDQLHEDLERRLEQDDERSTIENRLLRLREKTLVPYIDAYQSRWIHYLTPGVDGQPRLSGNPLRLARKVDRMVVEALACHDEELPGVRCESRPERLYGESHLFAHVLGGLTQPDEERLREIFATGQAGVNLGDMIERWFDGDLEHFQDAFRGSLARQMVGAAGIERMYDLGLAGSPGARVVYADARGDVREVTFERDPLAAEALRLTLDIDLQRFAMERIAAWEPKLKQAAVDGRPQKETWKTVGKDQWSLRGAFVMIDVKTGAVLALVNFPSYDPELLRAPTPEGEAYRQRVLRGDDDLPKSQYWLKRAPMLNRAVSGRYAPGSTFKILTAISMLEQGVINATSEFDEGTGAQVLVGDKKTFKLRTSHGAGFDLDIIDAIARSSNGFFWHFSEYMPGNSPYERYAGTLLPWAHVFGFDHAPGIDLPSQTSGHLPAPTPREVPGGGELAQLCIGQYRNLASPLQVARFMAAVASKGRLMTPRLAADGKTDGVYVKVSDETWRLVHEGMRQCVFDRDGTAHSRGPLCQELKVAGKTGTSQNGKFMAADGNLHDIPDHAWFAGFAPYDKPEVAFVMLAEYSGLWGGDVADLAAEIVKYHLERK